MADEADTETRQMPVIGIPPRNAAQWRADVLLAASISALALALYIVPAILYRPLFETPETRIAEVAREMLQSSNYVVPTVGGVPRLTKPPLPYWLTALTARIIGGSDDRSEKVMTRAVQLPSALLSAFTVFLIVLYGSTIGGRAAGVMSGIIFGFSIFVCHYSHLGYGDTTLTAATGAMFCAAAWILCVPHAGVFAAFGFGVAMGLAVLTKGHLAPAFLAGPLLIEIGLRRAFNARKVLLFAMGLVVAVCLAGPWFYLVEAQHPGTLSYMTGRAGDIVTKSSHDHDMGFYFYKLAGGLLPWTPVLLFAWPIFLLKKRIPLPAGEPNPHQVLNEHLRFFALGSVLGFIGLMIPRGGQEYYLLPLLPIVALASGLMLSRFKFSGGEPEEKLAWTQLVFGIVLGLLVIAIPLLKGVATGRADHLSDLIIKVNDLLGWSLIPIGVAVIVAFAFCARQWAEGRNIQASAVLGVVGFGALMVWTFHWTSKQREYPLEHEAGKIRAQLAALDSKVTVYSAVRGESVATLVFYLERPIEPLSTLRAELAAGKTPGPRVLVGDRERLTALKLTSYLPPAGEDMVVIPKLDDAEWQRISANAVEPAE